MVICVVYPNLDGPQSASPFDLCLQLLHCSSPCQMQQSLSENRSLQTSDFAVAELRARSRHRPRTG
jgi:hypothetical protein